MGVACLGLLAGAVFTGVGLREHAGFPAGAIVDAGFQAGIPAGKTEEGRDRFFERLLLRVAQVRIDASPPDALGYWSCAR